MLYETIRSLLVQCLNCDEDRVRKDTVILEDLECSPVDLTEVLMGLEEEFGVSLCETPLPQSVTVADLVRLVEDQL